MISARRIPRPDALHLIKTAYKTHHNILPYRALKFNFSGTAYLTFQALLILLPRTTYLAFPPEL